MNRFIQICATGFGSGYSPIASGTAGSIVAIPFIWAISGLNLPIYVIFTLVFGLFAVWISDRAEKYFAKKDPGEIVIDEIAGMFVTFIAIELNLISIIAGFVLFRFFDIVKIPPIHQSQKLPGGWGVVVDDLLAGVAANIVLQIGLRFL